MSRPQYLRRPSGKTKGESIADKDDRAGAAQRDRRADLLERFRHRLAPPPTTPGDGQGGPQ
ncbi:hypothetical protein [Streptomyces qinglanensis]|uniref:hypothetical protein n=1 Tax=Streptomyces qinglanensis TaxID=943816 RepID=UPI003D734308